MGKDREGEYTVWYRTPDGEGTGIVYLEDGKISGGDSMFLYGGSYVFDEDRFTATLTTRRYADGPTTVFGVDEIEVDLTGMFKGPTALCSGTAKQAPGVRFEARLFPSQEAEPKPAPAPANTDTAKLPHAPAGRHSRNPFRPG